MTCVVRGLGEGLIFRRVQICRPSAHRLANTVAPGSGSARLVVKRREMSRRGSHSQESEPTKGSCATSPWTVVSPDDSLAERAVADREPDASVTIA